MDDLTFRLGVVLPKQLHEVRNIFLLALNGPEEVFSVLDEADIQDVLYYHASES
jgi:hypothetical protein